MNHSDRGEGRPVRRRTRTFRPNYLSFAGTYQCNLSCPHCCVPIEWTDRLDIGVALRFLEDARSYGIDILGFTGGEPFLYPEFLLALTQRGAELGFRFDKIVTNGVWHSDLKHLSRTLKKLAKAGFSGKLGLSVDKFHGMQIRDLADFCRTARKAFDRDNIVSLSYASRAPDKGLEPIHALARELDAIVDWSPLLRRYLLVSPDFTMTLNWNHLAPVERAEKLEGAWDGTWFEEDYCEGPGQALIVNPKGEVKPCCGFASDLDQLSIGNIHEHTVAQVVQRARKHPYVGKLFREGLTSFRDEILERDPDALPGATSNHCYFCWHVITKNLVEAPTSPQGRKSLQLVGEPKPAGVSTKLLMAFDGKTVFLRRDLSPDMAIGRSRPYLIDIVGTKAIEPPAERMTWSEYQSWIDRIREAGNTLTTHNFSSCAK